MKLYFPLLFGWGEHPKFFSEYQLVQDFSISSGGELCFTRFDWKLPSFTQLQGRLPTSKVFFPSIFEETLNQCIGEVLVDCNKSLGI